MPAQSVAVTLSDGSALQLDGAALKEALQYRWRTLTRDCRVTVSVILLRSPTEGLPSLLSHARNLLSTYHNPPVPTSTIVTTGSQDALYKIMSTLLDPGQPAAIVSIIMSSVTSSHNHHHDQQQQQQHLTSPRRRRRRHRSAVLPRHPLHPASPGRPRNQRAC